MTWSADAEEDFDHPLLGQTTLSRMFEDSAERHADGAAQAYKGGVHDRALAPSVLDPAPDGEFATVSYATMRSVVRTLAAGFRALGIEAGDRAAVFSHTRMEWAQCDFALLAAGAVVTAVYPRSSVRQVRHVLADAGATAVVVAGASELERLFAVADDVAVDLAVTIDEVDVAALDREAPADLSVRSLAAVHDRGRDAFDRDRYRGWLDARDPGDLASLIYTSGTTGRPRGVRLTHRNFRSNVNQCFRRLGPRPDREGPAVDADATTLSFLPLAHVFERLAGHFLMFGAGATVAYAESPDTLREDFTLIRPTTGTSVPRVYEKLYDAVRETATESALGERVFPWASGVAREYHRADAPGPWLRLQHAVADRLVFRRIRAALGGRIDFLVSGGGSLSVDLAERYHGMGLPVIEGYGLTETSPVVAANPPDAPVVGTVGPPVVGCEVRIDEAVAGDDQRAGAAGTVGELLVRGPNVTDGYWHRPAETGAAFTGDWFRTGDVVERRPDGYLRFVERAKQILALSTGKNVAPGPIEDAFAASPVVEQCMVVGDGRKFVSALLVPDVEALGRWAEREGIDLPDEPGAICRDERVRERVQAAVDEVNEGLEPHARIKRFRLLTEEFTEDNDLLTPTLKKRRRNILERFAEEVDALYAAED